MKLDVKFSEQNAEFAAGFGEVHGISDGGYERGYAEGYETGNTEGYTKGHADGYTAGETAGREAGYVEGLAARTYETWTITLADGTIVEKDVAML